MEQPSQWWHLRNHEPSKTSLRAGFRGGPLQIGRGEPWTRRSWGDSDPQGYSALTIDSWPQKPCTKVSQATLYLLRHPLLSVPFKDPKCCSRPHISSGFSREERSQHRNIYLSRQNSTFFQWQHLPCFPTLRASGWRTCLRSQPISASYLSGLCDWFRNSHVT